MRVGFGYDGFSQMRALKRIKNGAIKSHTADYDRQGRSTKSTDPDLRTSTVAYEPYCAGVATTSARGVRKKTSFDTLCRLTEIEVGDAAANPLEVANTRETRILHYDDLGRLTQTDQITGSSSGGAVYGQAIYGQATYGQSSGGGTTTESRSYEFDALDRLKKVTFEDGKEMSYLHDEEGNVTQITEDASSATPKVTQFSYYGDGRLYQVTYAKSGFLFF